MHAYRGMPAIGSSEDVVVMSGAVKTWMWVGE